MKKPRRVVLGVGRLDSDGARLYLNMSLLPNSYDYRTWDKYITALRGKRVTLIAEIEPRMKKPKPPKPS